jgi:rSAM/selenodomain-associated transferase 1
VPAVLALFAKQPVAGQVKTRLCPPLLPEEAAALYEAMLLDILDQHASAGASADLALWYTPREGRAWFEKHSPAGYRLYPQQGSSLPERMRELFRSHAQQGYRRMVLRGTDSPTLPRARVAEALAQLERADLVLCPDRDGGYNLIGLREPHDALFELEMSTGRVLDWTVARGRELGLSVALLEPHHDVDTADDLRMLAAEVSAQDTPRTAFWLARAPARRPL